MYVHGCGASTGACFTDQGPHPWKMALPPPAARSRFSWSLPPPMLECWLAWSSAGLGQAATVAVRSQVQQPCFIQKLLFHSSPSWTLLESFYPLFCDVPRAVGVRAVIQMSCVWLSTPQTLSHCSNHHLLYKEVSLMRTGHKSMAES